MNLPKHSINVPKHFTDEQHKKHLGMLFHDIKAPINQMKGLISLLKKSTAENTESEELIELLQACNSELSAMVETVLRSTTCDDEYNQRLDFETIVNQIKMFLAASYDLSNIKIKSEIEDNITYCGNASIIRSIIQNLVENAIKYKHPDRKVNWINISIKELKSLLIIRVNDNGLGISKTALPFIFDEHFRVENGQEGYGMGLHMVKEALEDLDGFFNVDSQLGIGTTFTIKIPC